MAEPSTEEMRAALQRRLQLVDALIIGIERHGEILRAIRDVATPDEQVHAVSHLLVVEDWQSQAVLDLQLSRISRAQLARLQAERADLLRDVGMY